MLILLECNKLHCKYQNGCFGLSQLQLRHQTMCTQANQLHCLITVRLNNEAKVMYDRTEVYSRRILAVQLHSYYV